MIPKNTNFYQDSSSQYQLIVIKDDLSKRANISYGEISNDALYFYLNRTNAIKKISVEGNDPNFYLSYDFPEKNLVNFSFEENSILVLTCSFAFIGYKDEKGTSFRPFSPIPFAIASCFFQEKKQDDVVSFLKNIDKLYPSKIKIPSIKRKKGDSGQEKEEDEQEMIFALSAASLLHEILNITFYITTTSGRHKLKFSTGQITVVITEDKNGEEGEKSFNVSEILQIEASEEKDSCPVYLADIDVPIFGVINGESTQFLQGPISFEQKGIFIKDEEMACSPEGCNPCSSKESDCEKPSDYKNLIKKPFISCVNIYGKRTN